MRYPAAVGHNVSERKLSRLEAEHRSRQMCGWVVEKDGRVTEPQTPAALLARDALLEARCRGREACRRRVVLDAEEWCARGHGLTDLRHVKRAYRCALVPCGLDWAPERHPAGTPLGAFLGQPGAQVVVSCPCGEGAPRTLPIARFVELTLHAGPRRLGHPADRLPSNLVRGACSWCREHRWRIQVIVKPAG